jgi:hypothetical protein
MIHIVVTTIFVIIINFIIIIIIIIKAAAAAAITQPHLPHPACICAAHMLAAMLKQGEDPAQSNVWN